MKFDLEATLNQAIHDAVTGKEFAESIRRQVSKTLTHVVGETFGDYSPFAKTIGEQIKAALAFDVERLGLAGYNQAVLAIVKEQLDYAIHVRAAEQVKVSLQKLLDDTAPAEMKLSQLVDEFKQYVGRSRIGREEGVRIEVKDEDYGGRWVYLQKKNDYVRQDVFHFRIDVATGKVSFLSIAGGDVSKQVFAGELYGFARSIWRLYLAGTRLIIDETEFDESLPDLNSD